MRKANKVLENGIFKICDGAMIPFVSRDNHSYGPEGEIKPGESFELKILFCPGKETFICNSLIVIINLIYISNLLKNGTLKDKPGIYTCNLPIVVNDNYEYPYYNVEVKGLVLAPQLYFEPESLIMKPVPLGVDTSERIYIRYSGYEK